MKNFCFLVIVLFAFANANAAEKKADKNHVNRDGKGEYYQTRMNIILTQ